jgi:hypothetical protein
MGHPVAVALRLWRHVCNEPISSVFELSAHWKRAATAWAVPTNRSNTTARRRMDLPLGQVVGGHNFSSERVCTLLHLRMRRVYSFHSRFLAIGI